MAGLGWGATIIGIFLPWDFAIEHLQKFGGAGPIPYDPMLNYWLRSWLCLYIKGLPLLQRDYFTRK